MAGAKRVSPGPSMRRYAVALVVSALVLDACGGGERKSSDTTTTPHAPTATATGIVSKIPATGQTVEIKLLGDDGQNYRFEPTAVTIKPGDAVKFVMVSGGPHNISFDPATVPPESKAQLDANMDQKISELSSPLLMNPGETYTISFGGIKPGVYEFHCTPHLAMGMKGTITVQ